MAHIFKAFVKTSEGPMQYVELEALQDGSSVLIDGVTIRREAWPAIRSAVDMLFRETENKSTVPPEEC